MLVGQHDAEPESRNFKPRSHVVSLITAQLAHSLSLHDLCDVLRLQRSPLSAIHVLTPPGKKALAHANRERDADIAEALFQAALNQLQRLVPRLCTSRCPRLEVGSLLEVYATALSSVQLNATLADSCRSHAIDNWGVPLRIDISPKAITAGTGFKSDIVNYEIHTLLIGVQSTPNLMVSILWSTFNSSWICSTYFLT
jgi:hypothetical protein